MTENTKDAHIFDLMDLMYTALFGAHLDTEKIIKKFHEERSFPTDGSMFYEFFLHNPLHMELHYAEALEKMLKSLMECWKELERVENKDSNAVWEIIKTLANVIGSLERNYKEQYKKDEVRPAFENLLIAMEKNLIKKLKNKLKDEIVAQSGTKESLLNRLTLKADEGELKIQTSLKELKEKLNIELNASLAEEENVLNKSKEIYDTIVDAAKEIKQFQAIISNVEILSQYFWICETSEKIQDPLAKKVADILKSVPKKLRSKLCWNEREQLLVYTGPMTEQEKKELEKLCNDDDWGRAIGILSGKVQLTLSSIKEELHGTLKRLYEQKLYNQSEQSVKSDLRQQLDKLLEGDKATWRTCLDTAKRYVRDLLRCEMNDKDIWLLAPFAQRLARKSMVLIEKVKLLEDDKLESISTFPTEEKLATTEVIIHWDDAFYLPHLYHYWSWGLIGDYEVRTSIENDTTVVMSHFGRSGEKPREPFFADVEYFKRKTFASYITKKARKVEAYPLRKRSLEVLFGLLNEPIRGLDDETSIYYFLIPIVSSAIFYGVIMVFVPYLKDKKARKELGGLLAKHIKNRYVPVLTLLHEHFYEKCISKSETKKIEIRKAPTSLTLDLPDKSGSSLPNYNIFLCCQGGPCNECKYYNWEMYSDNEIEKHLHHLWIKRLTGRFEDIKDSLVFEKSLYSSPGMIQLLKDIFKAARRLGQASASLPAVLVVGEPGSGKDRIPKLLRIFSDCYRNGEESRINMASLKPDALIGPTIMGGEATLDTVSYSLEGILDKIRHKTIEKRNKAPIWAELDIKSDGFSNSINGIKYDGTKKQLMLKERVMSEKEKTQLLNEFGTEAWYASYKRAVEELYEMSSKMSSWKEGMGYLPTLVLDELNSLNVEFQGILLRFLENSEIVSVGGIEDALLHDNEHKKEIEELFQKPPSYKEKVKGLTDFLVVGIMNEDPEEITKERTVDLIEKSGGLAEKLLKEYLTRIRRLRPDLKARMIRNGKFMLPSIQYRMYDIPILFHIHVSEEIDTCFKREKATEDRKGKHFVVHSLHEIKKKELEPPSKQLRVFTTPRAIELLMDENITWSGSVRQLQALSKKVAEYAYEDWEKKKLEKEYHEEKDTEGLEVFLIREDLVKKAMEDVDLRPKNPKEKEQRSLL